MLEFWKTHVYPWECDIFQNLETFLIRLVGIINACNFFYIVLTFGKSTQLREQIFSKWSMLDVRK